MSSWSFLSDDLFSNAFEQVLPFCLKFLMIELEGFDVFIGDLLAEVLVGVVEAVGSWIAYKFFSFLGFVAIMRFGFKVIMIFEVLKYVFALDEEEIGLGKVDFVSLLVLQFLFVVCVVRDHDSEDVYNYIDSWLSIQWKLCKINQVSLDRWLCFFIRPWRW